MAKQQVTKSETTIPIPYPWATDRRAQIHTMKYILEQLRIDKIEGQLKCKKCEKIFTIEYDLEESFKQLAAFIAKTPDAFIRAPKEWNHPTLPDCKFCQQKNCCKPAPMLKKREINWLFLLLGQLLGCCTLNQIKYFCKHNLLLRTGSKDRLLSSVYVCLCQQLVPPPESRSPN